MSREPENLVVQLLRGMRADLAEMRAEVTSDVHSLGADVASDLLALEARQGGEHKQTRDQMVGLRRAVVGYRASVIGHGVIDSELEARLRRVEQHLDLPSSTRPDPVGNVALRIGRSPTRRLGHVAIGGPGARP
jgi:hypothetical protein